MKNIFVMMGVFTLGIVTSALIFWVMSKSSSTVEQIQSGQYVEAAREHSSDQTSSIIVQKIEDVNRTISQRLDRLEEKVRQQNHQLSQVAEQDDVWNDAKSNDVESVTSIVSAYGETVDRNVNQSVMTETTQYVVNRIEEGQWTLENAQHVKSMASKLTKQQLIDIQLSLNEAINTDRLDIEFDLAVHPIF